MYKCILRGSFLGDKPDIFRLVWGGSVHDRQISDDNKTVFTVL